MAIFQQRLQSTVPSNPIASMYEAFNPLTTLNKTHFIEWFSGDALDTIWTENTINAATFAMSDAVNGGFSIVTGTTTNDGGVIDFNAIRHYAHDGSVIIGVMQKVTSSNTNCVVGWNIDGVTFASDYALMINRDSVGFYKLLTKDASTASETNSDLANDETLRVNKLELFSSSSSYHIDGILKVTKTTNLPTTRLNPNFHLTTQTTTAQTGRITYLEAYNT